MIYFHYLQQIQPGGGSSTLKTYAQKPAAGYEISDSYHVEVVSSHVEAQRLSSTGSVGHTTFYF